VTRSLTDNEAALQTDAQCPGTFSHGRGCEPYCTGYQLANPLHLMEYIKAAEVDRVKCLSADLSYHHQTGTPARTFERIFHPEDYSVPNPHLVNRIEFRESLDLYLGILQPRSVLPTRTTHIVASSSDGTTSRRCILTVNLLLLEPSLL
jgi:hypothetical protein